MKYKMFLQCLLLVNVVCAMEDNSEQCLLNGINKSLASHITDAIAHEQHPLHDVAVLEWDTSKNRYNEIIFKELNGRRKFAIVTLAKQGKFELIQEEGCLAYLLERHESGEDNTERTESSWWHNICAYFR